MVRTVNVEGSLNVWRVQVAWPEDPAAAKSKIDADKSEKVIVYSYSQQPANEGEDSWFRQLCFASEPFQVNQEAGTANSFSD